MNGALGHRHQCPHGGRLARSRFVRNDVTHECALVIRECISNDTAESICRRPLIATCSRPLPLGLRYDLPSVRDEYSWRELDQRTADSPRAMPQKEGGCAYGRAQQGRHAPRLVMTSTSTAKGEAAAASPMRCLTSVSFQWS